MLRIIVLLLAAILTQPFPSEAAPPASLTLERVVLVSRHGVRSPTKPPASLRQYSSEEWPQWPVADGELTPHGAEAERQMAAALSGHYRGLLQGAGACSAEAWSDGADQRTRLTGQVFLDAALPDCHLTAQSGAIGKHDPIFGSLKECPLDPGEVSNSLADQPNPLPPERLRPALDRLYQVLTPPAERHDCHERTAGCFLYGDVAVKVGESGVKLDGPLAMAATMAENLALEYEENLPIEQVGWGRADLLAIEEIMAIHSYASHLTRENKIVASHNGARLMQSILQALEGPAAMKIFVGHDTNLSNLAGILGVTWVLPGQAEPTPPGGVLAFERWRDNIGAIFITLRFYYQTPQQLRQADRMERPGQVDITLDNCHEGPNGSCPLPHLAALMSAVLPKECVALTP